MFRLPTENEPIVPGQRVLVFPYHHASGETIGWYGSVISGRYPVGFRVQCGDRVMFVRPENMLAVDEVDQGIAEEVSTVWIDFQRPPADDQDEIQGHYCRRDRDWAAFRFTKHNRVFPHWEFRLSAHPHAVSAPALDYEVPCAWRLDVPLVMRVFKRMLGIPRLWTAKSAT